MDGAGPEVAEAVAARMAELANAVFPMSPMERQPTKLALLGDRGVSLRGAEVGMMPPQSCMTDVAVLAGAPIFTMYADSWPSLQTCGLALAYGFSA